MSHDDLQERVRAYVAFHEVDLRSRGLLGDAGLQPEFERALLAILRKLPDATTTVAVPLPDVPDDAPEG